VTTAKAQVDGRTARRDRNTDAVLDAVRELFIEGNYTPTAEAVAARSGVSLRSVYRYFEDTEALFRAAIARRVAQAEPLFVFPDLGEGELDDRIARLVDHRLALYAALGPEARAAVLRGAAAPLVSRALDARRRQLFGQLEEHFAPELRAIGGVRAKALLQCVDLLLQFESLEHLSLRSGLSRARVRRVLTAGVSALLLDARS
jgi:AcrR family transcriptional regulator